MKKLILHSFLCVICFAFITSCSKDVKTPSVPPKTTSVPKTNTSAGTQTQTTNHDQNHDCGNHTYASNSGGEYGGY